MNQKLDTDQTALGVGELLADPHHIRGDLRTIETAIRKQWELPEDVYERLPAIAMELAEGGKPREKLNAIKVLMAMRESDQPKIQAHLHQHHSTYSRMTEDLSTDERRQKIAGRIASLKRLGRDVR